MLKEALATYLAGLDAVGRALGSVAADIAGLAQPQVDQQDLVMRALLFQQTWAISANSTKEGFVDAFTAECIDMVTEQLAAYERVEAVALQRKQSALDVSYYSKKMQQLAIKEQQSTQATDVG